MGSVSARVVGMVLLVRMRVQPTSMVHTASTTVYVRMRECAIDSQETAAVLLAFEVFIVKTSVRLESLVLAAETIVYAKMAVYVIQ